MDKRTLGGVAEVIEDNMIDSSLKCLPDTALSRCICSLDRREVIIRRMLCLISSYALFWANDEGVGTFTQWISSYPFEALQMILQQAY